MPTWGIVLLIIGYLGIGMAMADYGREEDEEIHSGYVLTIFVWPVIAVALIVELFLDLFQKDDE